MLSSHTITSPARLRQDVFPLTGEDGEVLVAQLVVVLGPAEHVQVRSSSRRSRSVVTLSSHPLVSDCRIYEVP